MSNRSTLRTVTVVATAGILLATILATSAQARGKPRVQPVQSWQELGPKDRQRALDNLQRYRRLPESSRQRMDRSYESWRQLDDGERARVQRNFEKYRQMSPDQRREFENKYKRWKGGKGER